MRKLVSIYSGKMLKALGLMLIAIEDPVAMAELSGEYVRIRPTRPAEKQEYGDGLQFAVTERKHVLDAHGNTSV